MPKPPGPLAPQAVQGPGSARVGAIFWPAPGPGGGLGVHTQPAAGVLVAAAKLVAATSGTSSGARCCWRGGNVCCPRAVGGWFGAKVCGGATVGVQVHVLHGRRHKRPRNNAKHVPQRFVAVRGGSAPNGGLFGAGPAKPFWAKRGAFGADPPQTRSNVLANFKQNDIAIYCPCEGWQQQARQWQWHQQWWMQHRCR